MNNIKYLLLITLGMFFCGCEDFFSSTVDLDPPESTPKLAVTATWNATDVLLTAFVDGATDIFSGNNFNFQNDGLENATVELTVDGNTTYPFEYLVPTSNYQSKGFYFLTLTEPVSNLGTTFELKVTHPDYPDATATQQFPTKVVPTNYKYLENAGTDEYGYATSGVEVTLPDPADESNFYELAIFFKDSVETEPGSNIYEYYFNQTFNSSLDPNANQGPNYNDLFVSDNGFNGNNYKLLVQFENYFDTSNSIVVVANSISEDRFRFAQSLRAFRDAGDFGPFGEPVAIYSNFEGGLGTFGLGNPHIEEL